MYKWFGAIIGIFLGKFLVLQVVFGLVGFLLGDYLDSYLLKRREQAGSKSWNEYVERMFIGSVGAIAQVYLGKTLTELKQTQQVIEEKAIFQIVFITTIAHIFKTEWVYSQEKVNITLSVFKRIGFAPFEIERVEKTLYFALNQEIDFPALCENYKNVSNYQSCLLLLGMVYNVIVANEVVEPGQNEVILEMVNLFNIAPQDYCSLEAEYFSQRDDYYKLLGLESGAGVAQIKEAYKHLSASHSPDKLINLGAEYITVAREKLQRIEEAYQTLIQELQ